jgi:mannose-6-phosphate isomerase-like protein (cupin superfamily)
MTLTTTAAMAPHDTMVPRGTVLRNAFNKETFVFSSPEQEHEARFDVILEAGGSGGGNALLHIHPGADEHFTVKRGRIRIRMGAEDVFVEAGGTAVVPRGTAHCFANAGEARAELTIAFTPAQQQLRFFANFASLAARRTEWFSAKGEPSLLMMALVLHTYAGHLYLAGPPIWLQKLLFAVLAPVARLAGYANMVLPRRGR